MKASLRFSVIAILFLFLSSCSSTKIEFDKNVDFSQYHSFAFFKKGINGLKLPADKKRFVLRTISDALLHKNLSKSSRPDLIVNVFTDLHDRIDVYPAHFSPWNRGGRRVYKEKSVEGRLYIDIIDAKSKKIVWQGNTYVDLDGNDIQEFKNAIDKLLRKFPPKK